MDRKAEEKKAYAAPEATRRKPLNHTCGASGGLPTTTTTTTTSTTSTSQPPYKPSR
jgi:hypothetical protein